jgi:hypothetical protein
VFCRAVTELTMNKLPSGRSSEKEHEVIFCHICIKKNEEDKKRADMYCYACNDVFCDHHSGVSVVLFASNLWCISAC